MDWKDFWVILLGWNGPEFLSWITWREVACDLWKWPGRSSDLIKSPRLPNILLSRITTFEPDVDQVFEAPYHIDHAKGDKRAFKVGCWLEHKMPCVGCSWKVKISVWSKCIYPSSVAMISLKDWENVSRWRRTVENLAWTLSWIGKHSSGQSPVLDFMNWVRLSCYIYLAVVGKAWCLVTGPPADNGLIAVL